MLNLRIAFQKCVRRASILGNSPICHHTPRSSNVIHISRLFYSDDNGEDAESASISAQKDHRARIQTTSITDNKPLPDNANDPVPETTPSSSDIKSPDTVKDPEAKETTSITDTKSSSGIVMSNKDPLPDNANGPEENEIQSITESKALNTTQISKNFWLKNELKLKNLS
ncbi:hypothetical protein DdX_14773 [Ditylenchus destructor]|uniref:Uncharacterized protein n=1 Tax=Ditylenchus destructor TaxID=166010 RepID=A0AAD4MWF2_9BILA|nr:hypothetical protein DdX_14773 [Ditylenchus destructor]